MNFSRKSLNYVSSLWAWRLHEQMGTWMKLGSLRECADCDQREPFRGYSSISAISIDLTLSISLDSVQSGWEVTKLKVYYLSWRVVFQLLFSFRVHFRREIEIFPEDVCIYMRLVRRQLSPYIPFFEGIFDGGRIVSWINNIVKKFKVVALHSIQGINNKL